MEAINLRFHSLKNVAELLKMKFRFHLWMFLRVWLVLGLYFLIQAVIEELRGPRVHFRYEPYLTALLLVIGLVMSVRMCVTSNQQDSRISA